MQVSCDSRLQTFVSLCVDYNRHFLPHEGKRSIIVGIKRIDPALVISLITLFHNDAIEKSKRRYSIKLTQVLWDYSIIFA